MRAYLNRLAIAAISVREERRLEWMWVGRDFSRISRILQYVHWQLTMSSIWDLNAAKDSSIWTIYTHPDSGMGMAPRIGYPYHRLGAEKRVAWRGGGYATTFIIFYLLQTSYT